MNAPVRKMTDSTSSERVYHLETTAHCNSLFENMRDLQQSGMFCDVTVKVGQEEYLGHSVILVAASPYFKNVLHGEDRLKSNSIVKIVLPPKSFQLVLEYIYTGKLSITSKNVVDLTVASKYLQMDTLETACNEAMSTLLSLPTLSLDTTKGQRQSSSSGAIPRKHAKNSSYIFATGGWNRLYNEMSCCEMYNPETNRWYSIKDMHSKRQQHAVIGFNPFLYAFGGWGDEGKLSSVEVYDPIKNAWNLARALPHERSGHGICSLNGYIFICGGQNNNNDILSSVEQFDPLIERYKPCPPVNTERAYFKMAATGACIYAIGGWNPMWLDSVEMYDPREGRWSPGPSMGVKRTEHGVTVLNDYIYCTGGDGTSKSGERLDIRRNKWEPIPDMHTGRAGHELVTMNDSVYAIGGHLVEKFDPVTNRWFEMQRTLTERYHLGASVLDSSVIGQVLDQPSLFSFQSSSYKADSTPAFGFGDPPSTFSLQPPTVSLQPSSFSPQPPVFSPQIPPPKVSLQSSTYNAGFRSAYSLQPSTYKAGSTLAFSFGDLPSIFSLQPPTVSVQSSSFSPQPSVFSLQIPPPKVSLQPSTYKAGATSAFSCGVPPSTLTLQPPTVNVQSSSFSPQPSVFSLQIPPPKVSLQLPSYKAGSTSTFSYGVPPSTLTLQPPTVNVQSSSFSPQPSVFSLQIPPPKVSLQPSSYKAGSTSTFSCGVPPSTLTLQPPTVSGLPSAISPQPSVFGFQLQPPKDNHPPPKVSRQPSASNSQLSATSTNPVQSNPAQANPAQPNPKPNQSLSTLNITYK